MTRTTTIPLVNGVPVGLPTFLTLPGRRVLGVTVDATNSSVGMTIYAGFGGAVGNPVLVVPAGFAATAPVDEAWALSPVISGVPTVAIGSLRVILYDYEPEPTVARP